MVVILLFNREENLIGTLKDLIDVKHTEEINGINTLEIITSTTQEIKKDYRIIYKDIYGNWHEFIVKGIEESKDNGIIKELFCESSFYETTGDYIEDKRPQGTANSALEVALQPTRWQVGIVDDLGTNRTSFYHINSKTAVHKVIETWKGETRTRITVSGNKITGRFVDLFNKRGHDLGKRFTYTKDLDTVTRTIHRDDVITALYGYGKGEEIEDEEGNSTGGYGRRIDFSEINNGKAYVEDNDARLIWGRNLTPGEDINIRVATPYSRKNARHSVKAVRKAHVFGKVEFDDCEDKAELLRLTTEKLKELSSPLITYEAKVIDLKAFGIDHEGTELGDYVTVIDKDFTPELRVKARVIKIVRDLLNPENNEITLGNFIPSIEDSWNKQGEFIDNFRGKQGVWDRSSIINADGTIDSNYLNDIIGELNNKINADGGYVYISEDGEGLITYDKPMDQNPTMAIQIKGGSFRIANSKLPNGEWNFRTFGTGDGFVADMIIAGILQGGKVKFDLTNGTFLIGNSTENYFLWFDGSRLRLRLGNKDLEETFVEINEEIEVLSEDIKNTNTALDVMQGEIALKVEQEDIDKITIGARNLLLYSQSDIEFYPNSVGSGKAILKYDELIPYYNVKADNSISLHFGVPDNRFLEPLNALDEVTVSLEVRPKINTTVSIDGKEFTASANRWTKIYVTKTFGPNLTKSLRVSTPYSRRNIVTQNIATKLIEELKTNVKDLDYRNLQFEKGNKATDHQIAPHEIIRNIDSNKASLTVLADSVTTKVSKNEMEMELKAEADKVNLRFESGDFPLQGRNYRFDRESFTIGGPNDVVKHTDKSSTYYHEDGSYTDISAKGLFRYDSGVGREYHHLVKIIKFSINGDGQTPATRWIPIGPEFNDKSWTVSLTISDSMQSTAAESAIQRMVLTQGHEGGTALEPRYRSGQWEYPVIGYTTYYNYSTNSRRHSDLAGIMIVTA